MNTSVLLQSKWGFMFTLQETRSIHDSMNFPNIEFIELSRYAYFNNKTLESILQKIYLSNIEHGVTTSKTPFLSLLPQECMSRYFLKTLFINARPIPVQTKVHLKKLQFL